MNTSRGSIGRASAVAIVASLLSACSGGAASTGSFHPTLRWGTCPADIEIQYISRHRCGWLTTLEDRSRPAGRRLRLLVTETWPVGISPPPTQEPASRRSPRRRTTSTRRRGRRAWAGSSTRWSVAGRALGAVARLSGGRRPDRYWGRRSPQGLCVVGRRWGVPRPARRRRSRSRQLRRPGRRRRLRGPPDRARSAAVVERGELR